jgi:hypothetical protein
VLNHDIGAWTRVRKHGDHWLYFRLPLEMTMTQAARRVLNIAKVMPSVRIEPCLHTPVGLKLAGTRGGIRYFFSDVEPSK